jgi:hypothetical protein
MREHLGPDDSIDVIVLSGRRHVSSSQKHQTGDCGIFHRTLTVRLCGNSRKKFRSMPAMRAQGVVQDIVEWTALGSERVPIDVSHSPHSGNGRADCRMREHEAQRHVGEL